LITVAKANHIELRCDSNSKRLSGMLSRCSPNIRA